MPLQVANLDAGFVEQASLGDTTCGQCQRPLQEAACLDDNAPLLNVLTRLDKAPFLFVTAFVSGAMLLWPLLPVPNRRALQRRPV